MIEIKQKEPKLRFLDFDGVWKLKNIEELFDRVKNPVQVIANQEYQQIGIRSHGKGIFYKEKVSGSSLGNKAVFWIEPNVFIVNIVFAWERAVAITSESEVGMIASHRFPMYKPKKELTSLEFILYFFKTQRGNKLLIDASPGGAGRNKTLGQKEFGLQKLYVPEYSEQKKIGSFFSKLDEKILTEEKKLGLLQKQKKGYMQKIFNQELRFKDENENNYLAWKETTLKRVATSLGYGMGASAKEFDGVNQYIRITDIDEQLRTYISSGRVSPDSVLDDQYLVTDRDILFARTGASTGKSYRYRQSDGKMYFAGFLIRLRVKTNINVDFIYYQTLTEQYNQWVKIMSVRSGQPGINAKEFGTYSFKIPEYNEQQKIADFLSMLDLKIAQLSQKVKLLKDQKDGLMQQMFC